MLSNRDYEGSQAPNFDDEDDNIVANAL